MVKEDVYLVGIHRYLFRAGTPAKIMSVDMVIPEPGDKARLCYHIVFADGKEDWRPIGDTHDKIITFTDILEGKIPKVEL